jgi:MmyB-like transcription regulator ligand binding domain/Transposase DDE domain
VAHEVTNIGHDRNQLSKMAEQAREGIGHDALTVLADRGYFKGEEILACDQAGITPYVPKPLTSGAKAEGRFGKQDFVYIVEDDEYRCPAGERLTWRFDNVEHGLTLRNYWASNCASCPMKPQCTTGRERRIKRWEHEAVIDAMQQRLEQKPDIMRVRRPELYTDVAPELLEPPINGLRLSLHPQGLAPRIVNLVEWRAHLLFRLRRQIEITADPLLIDLLREIGGYPTPAGKPVPASALEYAIVVPGKINTKAGLLSFFSTTTVFGTPVDVTLSELALELFFPADDETAATVQRMTGGGARPTIVTAH